MLLKSVLVLVFVAQWKTQEYDEIVIPEMGVALKKSGLIASELYNVTIHKNTYIFNIYSSSRGIHVLFIIIILS